jgi:hypothetical protein
LICQGSDQAQLPKWARNCRTWVAEAGEPRRSRRRPVKDEAALARLLGELGNARLANNLNQLAKAANTGSLPVTPETVQAILTACQDVQAMRACLLAALGFRPQRDEEDQP